MRKLYLHRKPVPKPVATTNWRPKYPTQENKKYQRSSRVEAVFHNQFVNVSSCEKSSRKIDKDAKLNLNIMIRNNETINKQSLKLNRNGDDEQPSKPCSTLSSTKKRIMNRVSELSISRHNIINNRTSETPKDTSDSLPKVV